MYCKYISAYDLHDLGTTALLMAEGLLAAALVLL